MRSFEIMSAEDFFRDHGELKRHSMAMKDIAAIKHCSANMFDGCVAGTLLIPEKGRPGNVRLRCGFHLDGEKLLLIGDEESISHIMDRVAEGADIEDCDPAFVMFSLIEYLIKDDLLYLDEYEKRLDAVEDELTDEKTDIPSDLNGQISQHRKNLRQLTGYYKLLADVVEETEAFLSETDCESSRQFFGFLGDKIDRLYHDASGMAEYVLQIRDIYQSRINAQQNKVMQVLTIVTTIFMPLTLITGWYGMNFKYMPELSMPYAYAAVAVIAAIVVIVEIIIFKKKKWF